MEAEVQEARELQAEMRKYGSYDGTNDIHHSNCELFETQAPRPVLHNRHAPIPVSGQNMWRRFGNAIKQEDFLLEIDIFQGQPVPTEDGFIHIVEKEHDFEDWVLPMV
jgi:hypothetical protein